jgi:hypothetical protein
MGTEFSSTRWTRRGQSPRRDDVSSQGRLATLTGRAKVIEEPLRVVVAVSERDRSIDGKKCKLEDLKANRVIGENGFGDGYRAPWLLSSRSQASQPSVGSVRFDNCSTIPGSLTPIVFIIA